MDSRRRLIAGPVVLAAALASGCALLPKSATPSPLAVAVPPPPASPSAEAQVQPAPALAAASPTERPYLPPSPTPDGPTVSGRQAISAANVEARAASRSDAFVGGVQVFAYEPGRVFEVWTAPLRVTTLTLAPGETLVAKAAGDTVRWQIGETTSGAGPDRRVHVLLKPLERGLETNLVLTTDRRVYHLELKSGAADAFNAAIAWDTPLDAVRTTPIESAPERIAAPAGPVDAGYRIQPQGRRPRWTPRSVFNDGMRTFIVFDPDIAIDEAPALFLIAADGERQMVNYRQDGALYVVDRVFDRAELRLDGRRPQVVRLSRIAGDRP